MKILLIGASGHIGQAVIAALDGRHEVITAGRHSGDVRLTSRTKTASSSCSAACPGWTRWQWPPAGATATWRR